ncbi:putative membrane protein [Nitrosomonas sp. Nm84]|uniref:bestrophin family protein n=1 Tax=Nitrosomonas sp. Nm84 TaxID=200124 RepID=UPI000D7704AF|nr:bestrophin family ion channel [Nitrosomonas sp. Nm84]PXW91243.1 putative membrane protein [Nitrosomonas sp. Nm84]
MFVRRNISLPNLFDWSWLHLVWLLMLSSAIALMYYFKIVTFQLPWLPVSIIGTAVAIFIGFKNSNAYARMWEARKIWGAIVNSSRTWGMYVDGYISNQFTQNKQSDETIHQIKKRLIYRHIAWLYTLRSQLLIVTPWELAGQKGHTGSRAKYYQKKYGLGLIEEEVARIELGKFLPADEHDRLIANANTATQIINEQSRDLSRLREQGLINDFGQMELMKVLSHCYEHQGKSERIKKFPLPRQYANINRYFIGLFIFLFPFSMIPSLLQIDDWGIFIAISITTVVGWVYVMMELVGDYSENPFQGMGFDIPMLSLCRTIEIDLLEMLGEKKLPPSVGAKNGILM